MTLKEACRIAKGCGLKTVDEAVLNIHMHAVHIFDYDLIDLELYELEKDAKPFFGKTIKEVFG